jgi:hypothetical protein
MHGEKQSMEQTSVRWETVAPSPAPYFATDKLELIAPRSWPTHTRTRTATAHWIEAVDNGQHRQSTIDMPSPVDYDYRCWNSRAAA